MGPLDDALGCLLDQPRNEHLVVGVCVGVAVGDVDGVVLVLEGRREGEREHLGRLLLLARAGDCWEVADVETKALPAHTGELRFLLRVEQWPHPLRVERFRLDQVHDIEAVRLLPPRVRYLEVEPLAVLLRAPVIQLQLQVVLVLARLSHPEQIS